MHASTGTSLVFLLDLLQTGSSIYVLEKQQLVSFQTTCLTIKDGWVLNFMHQLL